MVNSVLLDGILGLDSRFCLVRYFLRCHAIIFSFPIIALSNRGIRRLKTLYLYLKHVPMTDFCQRPVIPSGFRVLKSVEEKESHINCSSALLYTRFKNLLSHWEPVGKLARNRARLVELYCSVDKSFFL